MCSDVFFLKGRDNLLRVRMITVFMQNIDNKIWQCSADRRTSMKTRYPSKIMGDLVCLKTSKPDLV